MDEDIVYLILRHYKGINRTTAEVLSEIFINGCSRQVIEEMKRLKTFAERENLLFDYIRTINEDEYEDLYSKYVKYTKKQKENMMEETLNGMIYINQMPIGEKKPIFYACCDILEKFKFLKEDDVYIKKFGREMKTLTKSWIGECYFMKLKQSDRRGFSVRSTGAVDSRGLPTRSFKSKAHLEQKSSSCIRFGEAETFNFSIAILPEDIIMFHALYRTSILGRKDLIKLAFSDNNKKAIDAMPAFYTSRVIEIFNTTLKVLGIRIDFVDDDERVKVLNNEDLKVHKLNDRAFVCTDYEFYLIEKIDEMRTAILDKYPVITRKELNRILTEMIRNSEYISEGMTKDLYKMIDSYNNTELEKIQESIGEEVNKFDGIETESEVKEETEEPKKKTKKKVKSEESSKEKPKKKASKKKTEA